MKKVIVLDANILFRAILGKNVPERLHRYRTDVDFYTPAFCYDELQRHIPTVAQTNNLPLPPILDAIKTLGKIVRPVDPAVYAHKEKEAKARISARDINDWPIVALALTLSCPVWTEDQDFFGTGLATWNSRNVEIFLSS